MLCFIQSPVNFLLLIFPWFGFVCFVFFFCKDLIFLEQFLVYDKMKREVLQNFPLYCHRVDSLPR